MFSLHPTELKNRRGQCKPLVDRLGKLGFEFSSRCNVCGSTHCAIISDRDRYGFLIRSAMCLNCGLIYLVDRFTANGYSKFYGSGGYRDLISRFKGKGQSIRAVQFAQVNYARTLTRALAGRISSVSGGKLLDVGGSTGIVSREFAEHFGLKPTLLEPAPEEVSAARALGIDAVVGSIEEWDTEERFDLILLCRTFEHLFDLQRAFARIRLLLKPGGLLYCDVADFLEICRREGPPQATTKIDHCYCVSQETAAGVFQLLGFEVVSMYAILGPDQLGFLLRPGEPTKTVQASAELLGRQLRGFREIETDWHEFGSIPVNIFDRLRIGAYRLKKRIAVR